MSIDDLAENTGYERVQVAQAMQALKQAGAVYSGRGGWRPVDESGETPRLAAVHTTVSRVPKLATVAQLTGHPTPLPDDVADRRYTAIPDEYAFAISEAGELLVTKGDAEKFAAFNPATTARLAAFLTRYQALLTGTEARAA